MKFSHLARLFYEWGWQIKHDQYVQFQDYLRDMLRMNRVIIIRNGEQIEGVIFFYLTDHWESLYKKKTWDLAQDNENGSQIYIDKMVCKRYTRQLRKSLQEAIESQFPQVELGVYHRAPKDRCIKIYSRRSHVPNSLCNG